MADLDILQQQLGYFFQDRKLLKAALTHSSVRPGGKDFERLEFLGDRVLGLVVCEIVYHRYAKEKEGDLAKRLASLVRREACEKVAESLKLANFLTATAADLGPRSAILANAIEALLGAMYLDGGLTPCYNFIQQFWQGLWDDSVSPPKDAKTQLQEWAQSQGKAIPVYQLLSVSGPDHAPTFEVKVLVEDYPEITATGPSKRQAEQKAAHLLLNHPSLQSPQEKYVL